MGEQSPGLCLILWVSGKEGFQRAPGLQNQLGKTSVNVERTRLIRATSL